MHIYYHILSETPNGVRACSSILQKKLNLHFSVSKNSKTIVHVDKVKSYHCVKFQEKNCFIFTWEKRQICRVRLVSAQSEKFEILSDFLVLCSPE